MEMSIYQMTKQLPPLSVRDICMPEMWLSIQNTVHVTGRNLFLLSRVISSFLLHFLLSPPPQSTLSKKSVIQFKEAQTAAQTSLTTDQATSAVSLAQNKLRRHPRR